MDGTLTVDRGSYLISLEAVDALRRVAERGVLVSLVSSNALPVVVGLSRYMGLNGPVIAESGALVYYDEWGLVELADKSARYVYHDILERFSEFVEDSWQNRFRLYDFALRIRGEHRGRAAVLAEELKEYVEFNFSGFTVDYSGYALHVHSKSVSKGVAVDYVLRRLGVSSEEALGVGDSIMDLDFIKRLGFKAAVGGSDRELVEACNIRAASPGGRGLVEILRKVFEEWF